MNNINEIISYFSSGSYENDKTNNAINYLKNNNLKIDLDKDKFNKLSNEQKKNLYIYINSSKDIDYAKMVFINGKTDTDKLVHVLTFKGEYPDLKYIVTLDNANLKETFHSAGVTYPISKLEISSKLLASYIFEPDVATFGEELMSYAESDEDFDIKQFYLKELHPYAENSYDDAFFDLKKNFNTTL